MSIVTYNGLVKLVDEGVLVGVNPAHINAASIDIVLGTRLMLEALPHGVANVVDLKAKETPPMDSIDLQKSGFFDLAPHQLCLGETVEKFYMPDDLAANYFLNSSLARAGLDAALAMWCDPGWHGSVLTLELFNNLRYHSLRLRPGMKIGQIVFHRGEEVPEHASYKVRGQYNMCETTTASKGLRSHDS